MTSDLTSIAHEFIGQNRPAIEECVRHAIEFIESDHTFRLPRTEDERQNAFETWLEVCRGKLSPAIEADWKSRFPGIAKRQSPEFVKELIDQHVWPEVELFLRSLAIQGKASGWVLDHIGDAVILGTPVFDEGIWRISIGTKQHSNLGEIVLNPDGNVIPEQSTSKQAILRVIRDRKLSETPAAVR